MPTTEDRVLISGTWEVREESMPATSSTLLVEGSGSSAIRAAEQLWSESAHANTSRAVFSAFCESMRHGSDPLTGGGPQLVGPHRIGTGRTFGVVYDGRRYLSGAIVGRAGAATSTIKWFNELFERCDGERMVKLSNAQSHPSR